MNPFPEYLANQLKEKLLQRRVVVWYDPQREFTPFLDSLELEGSEEDAVRKVTIGDTSAKLATYRGSYFALRREVEPFVEASRPSPILIYVGGEHRDRKGSVLMELERAGICYEPTIRKLARIVLRNFFSDGVIDEALASEALSYSDILAILEQGGEGHKTGSMLKVIFGSTSDNVSLAAKWLASSEHDLAIEQKGARIELEKLIDSRAGFAFQNEWSLGTAREKFARFLLVNEFRDDLQCEPPTSISMVPTPSLKEQRDFGRAILNHLRDRHSNEFEEFADTVETDLGLASAQIPPGALGRIDTFRFEERCVLQHCAQQVISEDYEDAALQVEVHSKSFWARYDLSRRQAQWEVVELLAQLGIQLERVGQAVKKFESGEQPGSAKLVKLYTAAADGWYLLDLAQRRLESRVAQMDQEPDCEEALAVMRSRVEAVLRKMATLFAKSFQADHWSIQGVLHQTRIYPAKVESLPGKIAWFHVDALRYEMGVDLLRQLSEAVDAEITPAIATLPSITPLCMAALLPGAAASYSVVAQDGKVGGKIGDSVLQNVTERMKHLKAAVPDSTDISLERLLQLPPSKVLEKIEDARLVVVRSQEIDSLGEKNELLARHLMDTLIGNIARAARKLAKLGYERFVITADHGHQFGSRKGDDMKIEKPGGNEIEAHRRCWIGKGGATSSGAVRIAAAELGYDSDLEFVFPTDLGVFKTGGGLSYHHGGFSLQELVIPVLSLRIPGATDEAQTGPTVTLLDIPDKITNRVVGVKVDIEADLLVTEPLRLRLSLVGNGEEAGQAGMAIGGEFKRETGVLTLAPGQSANVAMVLSREDFDAVKIVVQDAETGAVLSESKTLPVQLKL